jgi:hypothetical protein|tara:strand:- start:6618 stop:6905 length:288 start_codon:yes stop_codon:yes gene_type:complete
MRYRSKLNREEFLEIEQEIYDMFSDSVVRKNINKRFRQLEVGNMSPLTFMHNLLRTMSSINNIARDVALTKIVEIHEYKKYKERNINEDNLRELT